MNLPNLLTLSRIPLMLIVIGLIYPSPSEGWPWIRTIALVVFLFAALTDWLDGWLARKFGQVSEFGKFMDALSDKVLTLGMFTSLLALGVVPKWTLFPILLILARELLITGLRLVAAGKGKTLAAEKIGKLKTVIQLTCISLVLSKIAVAVDFENIIEAKIHAEIVSYLELSGLFTLSFASLITVFSGFTYMKKYWRFFLDEEK